MEISDEAIEFVELLSEATDMCLGDCLGDLSEDMRAGSPKERSLRAATVIEDHARAAQVAVLRELVTEDDAELDQLIRMWTNVGPDSPAAEPVVERISSARRSKARIESKLAELEAGAGQAEVRDE